MKKLIPFVVIAAFAATPVLAHPGHGYGPARGHAPARDYAPARPYANAFDAIDAGVRNGRLTPREARQLRNEERKLQQLKRRALRDGYLTIVERRRIQRAELDFQRSLRAKMDRDYRTYRRVIYRR